VPGSGGTAEAESAPPSASASDAAEDLVDAVAEEPATRPQAKSAKKRSAVPAWDDIVFGARRS
jgi:hypothetical protein